MICDKIRILEFADIHFCHRKTPTQLIIHNLNVLMPFDERMAKYDMIMIPGDVWDRLVSVPDPDVFLTKRWIVRLLTLCKRYDITLLVVEGTPSHDRKQSKWFEELNVSNNIHADLYYVDTLSIVHFEKFGIDVLCVPDEWNHETDDTWQEVTQLLSQRGLDKVDFCAMHGAFSYQLPAHVPAPTHDMERYLGITRYLIFIGHIHRYSQYDRIFAAGSPDRLAHGEEEAKGILDATVNRDGEYKVTFIENKGAMVYKTLVCDQETLGETYQFLEKEITSQPEGSHIRLKAKDGHPILASMKEVITTYPGYHFTLAKEKEETVSQTTLEAVRQHYEPIEIHSGNIDRMMVERLTTMTQDPAVMERAKELIREFI